ncbi:hypothetical protein X798_06261 [Onchocerca flexuosa]|uniref:FH2 domain-containing protein n=1 Tax=Onchocerca flexuosa TaxID=387005 RepID=A0A238BMS6_9BILA|nr:hypothetical protein X798_06261 [Onchocerca flexuosa]
MFTFGCTHFSELHLNFDELESMFSCAVARTCTDASNVERRKTRKNAVITLLSHKRSFNVSIFLKQFKEEIKESKALPKIFCMLVQIGNFLNANATFGNAAGFKLNSLWRILDVKATQKSITLLHFIAMNSREHMESMEEQLEQMDHLISYLAAYFCEDEKHFKIEECFKILSTFICRLREALSDNEKRARRLKRMEERANVENIVSDSSSKFILSQKTNNITRTLEELLESDSHSDIRHSRARSNINQTNILLKRSNDERENRKIVHRTVRRLTDEVLNEGDDMSPIMKLRKQSRNKSDAYLIRNSQNLDEFLEVAERVEKKVVKQHIEHNKETPNELNEMVSTFSASTKDAELEKAPSVSNLEKSTPKHNSIDTVQEASSIHDNKVVTMFRSMDKMKQRVAVERDAEIPLSKTIRTVRTLKSIQKASTAQASNKDPRSSPYRIKSSTSSTSRKSTPEQQSITLQPSATSASTNRKAGTLEQTYDESKNVLSKSSVQSGKSFTTITTKESVIRQRNGIVLTSKTEMSSSRMTKTMTSRKPRSGASATNLPNIVSAKNTTPIRMPKKSVGIACNTDTEIPCTSNSSTENSPKHTSDSANTFDTLTTNEHSIDSQSFWRTADQSTHAKSISTFAKGTLHSHENISSNHDPSSSKPPAVSRPKSAPQRTSAVNGATPSTRITPSRVSPSTLRRPVRGTTKPGPQVSVPTSVTSNPHNRNMKRADSCSTASRPLLIKTGAISRPRWK